ncbi:MAG: hypothetical protein N2491_07545 [Negativicutes bacterium]|nr:hypothetical protein [Negativicutes bacterium]
MDKQKFGTLTASKDANEDYTSSTAKANSKAKQNASKQQYGTLTAKADANQDYE